MNIKLAVAMYIKKVQLIKLKLKIIIKKYFFLMEKTSNIIENIQRINKK